MIQRDQHARIPAIVAELGMGFQMFLRFAVEIGASIEAERGDLQERCWTALIEAGAAQAAHQHASEPPQQFVRLLATAIASGRAHIAGTDGKEPESNLEAFGWRGVTIGTGRFERTEWHPQGRRIGWIDGVDLYVEPEAAFAGAQNLAGEQGDSLSVQPRTLWKRMREKGLLASWDQNRQRHTVRRTMENTRKEVLHLRVSLYLQSTVPTVPHGTNTMLDKELQRDGSGQDRPADRPTGDGDGDGQGGDRPTLTAYEREVYDEMGRLGRSGAGGEAIYAEKLSTVDDDRERFAI